MLTIPLSLYIHIPWCLQKCPYCDFNSHTVKDVLPESDYIKVLLNDLAFDIAHFNIERPLESIFIGGGTPSLLSPDSIALLLEGVSKQLTIKEKAEITLEANPGTFEQAKFKAFKQSGINRLSIGIQSFNPAHLKKLGRIHTQADALQAGEIARSSGFDNFNLDLMFGLPEQSLKQAKADIKQAIALKPPHLSLYQLTLEPNTYFHKFPPPLPQDDLIFEIQQHCQQLLQLANYQHYEISAYAKQGFQCQHNLNYWKFGDYLGIGAGAHGKISQQVPQTVYRTSKLKSPALYLEKNRHQNSVIPIEEFPIEFMMNQLRLKQGFSGEHYQKMTGLPLSTLEPGLSTAVTQKFLTQQQNHYRLTEKGWNFLDSLLQLFIT
ncbi:MAG: radical SAM family heme chaperone HemW [Methylococcales bacterium]|nr:radical SAM family heme chaperone HemW [Methylococcales bacterium]